MFGNCPEAHTSFTRNEGRMLSETPVGKKSYTEPAAARRPAEIMRCGASICHRKALLHQDAALRRFHKEIAIAS
jgi:hypothetical protein